MRSKKARHRRLRYKSNDVNDQEEDANPAKSFDLFQSFISNKFFDSSLKFEKISPDANNNNTTDTTTEEIINAIRNLEVIYDICIKLYHSFAPDNY